MLGAFFFFWLSRAACGILVPRPGMELAPPALEAQSLNHWTARKSPGIFFKGLSIKNLFSLCIKVEGFINFNLN